MVISVGVVDVVDSVLVAIRTTREGISAVSIRFLELGPLPVCKTIAPSELHLLRTDVDVGLSLMLTM